MIDSFSGKYDFLSNFYPHPVTVAGLTYPTNEHAYQAMKSSSRTVREHIAAAASPGQAKRMGRHLELKTDWNIERLYVMELLVDMKFNDPDLRWRLIETDAHTLIEGNTWGDTFWGVCNGVGENHLGRILERKRKKEINIELDAFRHLLSANTLHATLEHLGFPGDSMATQFVRVINYLESRDE